MTPNNLLLFTSRWYQLKQVLTSGKYLMFSGNFRVECEGSTSILSQKYYLYIWFTSNNVHCKNHLEYLVLTCVLLLHLQYLEYVLRH